MNYENLHTNRLYKPGVLCPIQFVLKNVSANPLLVDNREHFKSYCMCCMQEVTVSLFVFTKLSIAAMCEKQGPAFSVNGSQCIQGGRDGRYRPCV